MIDLTPLLQAVISLGAAIITVKVIPLIKSKTTTEQQAQLRSWAQIGVAAAEQIYSGHGRGSEKKQYVLDFLKDKGFDIDTDTLNALIESEVKYLWTGETTVISAEVKGELAE